MTVHTAVTTGAICRGSCNGVISRGDRTLKISLGRFAHVDCVDHRDCVECDDVFVPLTARQIRCVPCQVESDFG